MHLHQLKVKNLASLRGEHTIDFTVLASQDLFAITGETGAGKSTILNAISLALYHRVYKRQLNQSDLVTLGERDAHVSLKFSVRGVMYLATWGMTVLKRDGTPLGTPRPDHFFYELPADGDEKEARVLDVTPDERLHLDFEQFCKCVVLNQGEFARFLTASFTERRDILERLYPSDNIDSVGSLARRKWEERQTLVQNLDVQTHALETETIFDVNTVKTEMTRRQEELNKADENLQGLKPHQQLLSDLMGHARYHENAQKRLKDTKIELDERTITHNAAMSTWSALQNQHQLAESMWNADKGQIEADVLRAQEVVLLEKQWQSSQEQLTQQKRQLSQLETREKESRTRHEQLATELKNLKTQRYPLAADWTKINLATIRDLERREAPVQEKLRALKELLTQLEVEGKTHKEKEQLALQKAADTKAKLPKDWQEAADIRTNKLQKFREEESVRQLHEKKRLEASAKLAEVDQKIAALTEDHTRAQSFLQEASWWAALNEMRTHLLNKHPDNCPVCERTTDVKLWETLTTRWSQDAADAQDQRLRSGRQDAEKIVKRMEALQNEKALWQGQQLTALAAPAVDAATIETLHWELLRAEDAHAEALRLVETSRTRWKNENAKVTTLQSDDERLRQDINSWIESAKAILGVPLVWSEADLRELQADAEIARLHREKNREDAVLAQQLTQLTQDREELAKAVHATSSELAQKRLKLDDAKAELKARYPEGVQERLKARTEEVRTLDQKARISQNEYRQKERELGEARARVGSAEDQMKQTELLYTQEKTKLGDFNVSIGEAIRVLEPMHQASGDRIKDAEETIKRLSARLSELKTLLEKDRQTREKRDVLVASRAKLQVEVDRYKRLMEVLGQEDLRTYVLSLVEAALIKQTNHELQKLCGGRYEVLHNAKKGKMAPEFWVIDRWRDGMTRKVVTLSGGETFMVSLAMALALAEMTRGRADIDSFFIDEGFGTLDEDSLEGVLDMLQQVRSRGKQIGLITHVKALSARLPMNLSVQKDGRGNSTVAVVWN